MDKAQVSRMFEEASQQAGRLSEVLHKYADYGVEDPGAAKRLRREYIEQKNTLNKTLGRIIKAYPELSAGTNVAPTPVPKPQPEPEKPAPQPTPEPAPEVVTPPQPEPQPEPEPEPQPVPPDAGRRVSRFNGLQLFVNPHGNAANAANRATDPYEQSVFRMYADQSVAFWYGGWGGALDGLRAAVNAAREANQVFINVLYNIPNRDASGGYSAGGASYESYRQWRDEAIATVGNHPTIWIVEPDALADLTALPADRQGQRVELIRDTGNAIKTLENSWVYLDAGNYGWHAPNIMAPRLRDAGIENFDGFASNVSGFGWLDRTEAWCEELSGLLDGKHYVIDTSRNGAGPWTNPAGPQWDDWCNPPGRLLGPKPEVQPSARCDAYLWIKPAGESDGDCKGGPPAGVWYPTYALELAREAMPR